VILPRHNERDIEDVPPEVRRDVQFILADRADEVLRHALNPTPAEVQRTAG